LNKRVLSPVIAILLATLAFIPMVPINVHAQSGASLTASPTPIAGNPGDTFAVTVLVDGVMSLVAYDVQLNYNGAVLSAQSVDFSGPFAGSACTILPVVESSSDATGSVRAAVTTLFGCTVDVTSPTAVFVVTFKVLSRLNSPLHISTDQQCACTPLAQFTGGSVIGVTSISYSDGTFFGEPNIRFISAGNVTTVPFHPKIKKGDRVAQVEAFLTLGPTETVPGFAFVVFDITGQFSGTTTTITSNEAFLSPGATQTVSAPFAFPLHKDHYTVFATLWRGSSPTSIVMAGTAAPYLFNVT
jgi:hypothetical protein